jgi:stress-induced morphogen
MVHESLLHSRIRGVLRNSEGLQPIHVEVTNESYWYLSRHVLGPRKQMANVVTLNQVNNRYESYIFKLKMRESDGEVVPQRQFLSTFNTKIQAIKHCEAESKLRDSNPAEDAANKGLIDETKIRSTHFKITIVSSRFDRLPHTERLLLVYQELLSALGSTVEHSSNLSRCCPRMKFCSTYRTQVFQVL